MTDQDFPLQWICFIPQEVSTPVLTTKEEVDGVGFVIQLQLKHLLLPERAEWGNATSSRHKDQWDIA